jgi:predicted negative regulator of RcsB-dependent stress response
MSKRSASNGLRRKLSRGITPSLALLDRTGGPDLPMPTLLSTDPVLETQVFWDRHSKKVLAALILAILVVAAWGGYRIYSTRRDVAAANLLTAAKTAAEFQKVITQYPGTPAGGSAYLFLAEEQRKEKKLDEANTTLRSFVEKYPAHELKGIARMAMAAILEALGKRDEALAAYQRLAADDPQGFTAPIALISQVHMLKEKNQLDEARQVCETILTKYRDSLVANEATRQLRLLKPPTPPEAATAKAPAPTTNLPNFLLRPADLPTAASPAVAADAPPAAAPTAAKRMRVVPKKP